MRQTTKSVERDHKDRLAKLIACAAKDTARVYMPGQGYITITLPKGK